MIPSRLITLRRYPNREFAEAGRNELIEAGIPAYVKRGFLGESTRSLMVGEEHVAAALAVLGGSDRGELLEPVADEALQCPRCQSKDIAPLRPYAGLTFAAGASAALGALLYGPAQTFAPLLGATILISTVVYVRSPRWRCRTCGLVYGQPRRPSRQG